jgi:hypothetical protein
MVALYGRPLGAVHRATRGERSTLAREGVALCDRIGGRLRWRPSRWVSSEAASGARRRRVRRPRQRRIPTPPCRSRSGARRRARCSRRVRCSAGAPTATASSATAATRPDWFRRRCRASRGRGGRRGRRARLRPQGRRHGVVLGQRQRRSDRQRRPAQRPEPRAGRRPAGGARHRNERRNTCAVAVDGGTWCWGSNVFGESAQPAGVREVLTPTRIAGLGPAVEVDTGQNHTCARLADGTVWCWGGSGPLGDGASVQRHSPVQVQGVAGARRSPWGRTTTAPSSPAAP